MNQRNYRNVLFISLSQFGIAFSFNFVMVFLPFFIHDISPYSSQDTLIWVGFIMGAPSFAAALTSTFWGSLTSRLSPKVLFMRGLLSHAVSLFVLCLGFGRTGHRILEFKPICRECAGTHDRSLRPCLFKLELALSFRRQHGPAGLGQLCVFLRPRQEYHRPKYSQFRSSSQALTNVSPIGSRMDEAGFTLKIGQD